MKKPKRNLSAKPKRIDAPELPWTHRQLSRNCFRVSAEYTANSDWEFWFLATSDQHWDNPKSDHAMQLRHLDEAVKKKAPIVSCGDYFCLMQGKFDKRANKSSIRKEHLGDNYFNLILDDAVEFLAPYAKNYVMIAVGNHEQAASDRHEISMIDMFCGALNHTTGSTVFNGGYGGYLQFHFKQKGGGENGRSLAINIHYEHGAGGDSPITGDMIGHFRTGFYHPDADILMTGHNHNKWTRDFSRARLNQANEVVQDIQTHIKISTYKDEYRDGSSGWHVTRRGPPKPLGAYWIRFYWHRASSSIRWQVIDAS